MINFIDSVRKSVNNRNWTSALSLALSLPDICGYLQYGKIGSKKRYIQWWEQNVQCKYTVKSSDGLRVFLSGSNVYALRCAFVHQGSDEIEFKEEIRKFQFTAPGKSTIHNNKIGDIHQLQVDVFCEDISSSVETWWHKNKENEEIKERLGDFIKISEPDILRRYIHVG